MKLCIRQKVFSWRDRFTVWDENGLEKYFVEGEIFSWGKKLHVYDTSGNEVAFVRQKVLTLMPRYHVYIGEAELAQIAKKFTLFKPRYVAEGLDWEITGNFFAHDYKIDYGGSTVTTIHKEWFTWGDCYVLDIADARDEIAALAVVLAIDCDLAQQTSGNNN